ncbi:MAG: topoisomerase DNA-binding C4 zinc finger domain-containing protein, partial [Syntrophales bacterium]
FLGCSGYPECKHIVRIPRGGKAGAPAAEAVITDTLCDTCGKPMALKTGRFGKFLGCTGYPECRTIHKYKPSNP